MGGDGGEKEERDGSLFGWGRMLLLLEKLFIPCLTCLGICFASESAITFFSLYLVLKPFEAFLNDLRKSP
jgi:hypothetical protein